MINDPGDSGDPEMREQDELQPDLDILNLYADEHPGVWGGVEFAASARPARLVAFITEERDRHAALLRSVVPHPDRLDVEQVAMSARDRAALAGQLVDRLRATLPADSSFGVGHTAGAKLSVMLPSGFDEVARQLLAEYGEVITVEVGVYYRPLSTIETPADHGPGGWDGRGVSCGRCGPAPRFGYRSPGRITGKCRTLSGSARRRPSSTDGRDRYRLPTNR